MNGLKDRIALVTGASRGIGKFIAEALAAEGFISASLPATKLRSKPRLHRSVNNIKCVLVVPTDVSVRSQLEQLVQRTPR